MVPECWDYISPCPILKFELPVRVYLGTLKHRVLGVWELNSGSLQEQYTQLSSHLSNVPSLRVPSLKCRRSWVQSPSYA